MNEFGRARPSSTARGLVAVVAVTLLAGCGTRSAGTAALPSAAGSTGPCGVVSASPTAGAPGGVRITAVGPACAEYEVTNGASETSDITVVFGRSGASGGLLDNLAQTTEGIAPGASAQGRVDLDGTGTGVKVLTVRSVPSAEASRPDGPCPASGVRVSTDAGDAAMGLRVVGLHLRNCGTAAVTVNGYPELQLLDLEHRPVDGVQLLRGGAGIASGTGADDPPRAVALKPGEGARASLVWRNTTGAGDPVNAPYVRVRAMPGAAPVMVVPELDLGTTGRLGVGAWVREEGEPPPATRRPGPLPTAPVPPGGTGGPGASGGPSAPGR
ncbi:DUF4232 domain-containing protein [Kitasatospora sp. NPDC089797]|uniref:DUF4232 domain-containing protein n=1 Tax=Kitasatospora sp. NPDC089797 TaxID=3155298 RepID=UPI00343DC23E